MDEKIEAVRDGAVFVGQVLGPLFSIDPSRAEVRPRYDALAALDVDAAAQDWPGATMRGTDAVTRVREALVLVRDALAGAGAGGARTADAEGAAGSADADAGAANGAGAAGDARGVIDDDLIWEYRRLFVGPGHLAAPPWGSVYTDRECVIFGLTTLELRRWMRENRIKVAEDKGEPEDHIGTMLSLMAWIAEQRPELLPEYLRDHLLTWAPHYLDVLERETAHPFFRGLAQLTRESIAGLQEALALQVAVPRFYR